MIPFRKRRSKESSSISGSDVSVATFRAARGGKDESGRGRRMGKGEYAHYRRSQLPRRTRDAGDIWRGANVLGPGDTAGHLVAQAAMAVSADNQGVWHKRPPAPRTLLPQNHHHPLVGSCRPRRPYRAPHDRASDALTPNVVSVSTKPDNAGMTVHHELAAQEYASSSRRTWSSGDMLASVFSRTFSLHPTL